MRLLFVRCDGLASSVDDRADREVADVTLGRSPAVDGWLSRVMLSTLALVTRITASLPTPSPFDPSYLMPAVFHLG